MKKNMKRKKKKKREKDCIGNLKKKITMLKLMKNKGFSKTNYYLRN
jgi:hypothetical protein